MALERTQSKGSIQRALQFDPKQRHHAIEIDGIPLQLFSICELD